MRTLFVTSSDEAYAPLLRGLVLSLQQWQPQPYTDLAVFDLGLSETTSNWLAQYAVHIVRPGWDLPVSNRVKAEQAHARGLTVRPFLPDYFPGYDIYLAIDADCWVQERYALDWYLTAARRGALVVTPQVHHAYQHDEASHLWRTKRLHAYFGPTATRLLNWSTYVNAGVFALRGDAPHWGHWRDAFIQGLNATDGNLCCDQTALNYMLWTQHLPAVHLPATCNWLCHLAAPHYDTRRERFREPTAPGQSLGILHLAAGAKDMRLIVRTEHGEMRRNVRFGDGDKVSR